MKCLILNMCNGSDENKNRAEPLDSTVISLAYKMPLSLGFYGYPLCFHLKQGVIIHHRLQTADWTNIVKRSRCSNKLAGLDKAQIFN